MRKLYTLILLLASTSFVSSQSITSANATLWNGGDGSSFVDAYVDIINTSNNTIDVSVVRKSEILVAGHESNFCWGVSCYPPFISTSPTLNQLLLTE